jgi:hypothetical protein
LSAAAAKDAVLVVVAAAVERDLVDVDRESEVGIAPRRRSQQ